SRVISGSARKKPAIAATSTAMAMTMIRLRSSSRCSRRLIVASSRVIAIDASRHAGAEARTSPPSVSAVRTVARRRLLRWPCGPLRLSAHGLFQIVGGLAELLDPFPDRIADIGQLAGAEDDQDDHQQQDELPRSGNRHLFRYLRSLPFERGWPPSVAPPLTGAP